MTKEDEYKLNVFQHQFKKTPEGLLTNEDQQRQDKRKRSGTSKDS